MSSRGFRVVTAHRTRNYGNVPMVGPEGSIAHHTAGSFAGDMRVLLGNAGIPVSCNDYIAKDGTIYEMAPFPRRAWHAGAPDAGRPYRRDANTYYWGTELENLGNGSDPYPRVQVEAYIWRMRQLRARHPSMRIHFRHRDLAPSRKIDTSDNFPWNEVKARIEASHDAPEPEAKPQVEQRTALRRYCFVAVGEYESTRAAAGAAAMNAVARSRGMKPYARVVRGPGRIAYVSRMAAQSPKLGRIVTVVCGPASEKHLSGAVEREHSPGPADRTDIISTLGTDETNPRERLWGQIRWLLRERHDTADEGIGHARQAFDSVFEGQ